MKLNALLMCHDQGALRMLVSALDELGVDEEVCFSEEEALELLALGHYSALVVDCDQPGALQVARMARLAPGSRRPVIFAVIDALTDVGSAFQAGANFVLYKPLVWEQVQRSLRAGRAFMRPDRRRSQRHKTESLVYLRFGDACAVPALVTEISEDGLSVQASEPLPVFELPLRFILPGTSYLIEGTGEVTWADDHGRAGIFFSQLTAEAHRQLRSWMGKNSKHSKKQQRVALRTESTRRSAQPTP